MLACLAEQEDTARSLLDKGVLPDHIAVKSSRYRSIHIAARSGNTELLKLLLEYGASENVRLERPDWDTPLHLTVSESNAEDKYLNTAKAPLRVGADFDAYNGSTATSLILAITKEDQDEKMIKLLVECGADIDIIDGQNRSPVYFAVKKKSTIMRSLWDTEYHRKPGRTILSDAAWSGNKPRVQQLVNAGYDIRERDKFDRAAYQVARNNAIRGLLTPKVIKSEKEEQRAIEGKGEGQTTTQGEGESEGQTASKGESEGQATIKIVCPLVKDGMTATHSRCYCDACVRTLSDELFYL